MKRAGPLFSVTKVDQDSRVQGLDRRPGGRLLDFEGRPSTEGRPLSSRHRRPSREDHQDRLDQCN